MIKVCLNVLPESYCKLASRPYPCEETAMLVHKIMANLAHVLHNNSVKFPKDFFLFCSLHQHGGDDVR